MSEAPCGCEQREDAELARPGEREALLAVAEVSAERWQCPRWGYAGVPHDTAPECLTRVEILTRCRPGSLAGCPRLLATQPEVIRALRLYRATQGAGLTWDDDPPAVLVACVEALGGADATRIEAEHEDSTRKP